MKRIVKHIQILCVVGLIGGGTLPDDSCPERCVCLEEDLICPEFNITNGYGNDKVANIITCNSNFILLKNSFILLPRKYFQEASAAFIDCTFTGLSTYSSIFENFNTTRKDLYLEKNNGIANNLKRQHLKGLNELVRLRLYKHNIIELDEDVFYDMGKLEQLYLDSNKIRSLPTEVFSKLKNLIRLDLSANNIETLPTGLFRSQKLLKFLRLNNNRLTALESSTFSGLSSLVILHLRYNDLEKLEPKIFTYLEKLQFVHLNNNKLNSLSEELFSNNSDLIVIHLHENRKLKAIPHKIFSSNQKLGLIELSFCSIQILDKLVFRYANTISEIYLNNNQLTKLNEQIFYGLYSLKKLNLGYNNLTILSKTLFLQTDSLEWLNLSYNKITNISSILFSRVINIKKLFLNNNNIHVISPTAFGTTNQLQILELQNNFITFEDKLDGSNTMPYKMNELFSDLYELEKLNLRNNSIKYIHLDFKSSTLREIDLSCNQIESLNFSQIHILLNKLTTNVNLSQNRIRKIILPDENIENSLNNLDIELSNNSLHCDCDILSFLNFIERNKNNQKNLKAKNSVCASPSLMIDINVYKINPKDLLQPLDDKMERCPTGCKCYLRCFDRRIIINCSKSNLTSVPPLTGLSTNDSIELNIENNKIKELPNQLENPNYRYVARIFARNNNIERINENNWPTNLISLDVRENKLKRFNVNAFKELYFRSGAWKIDISLSGNPWICDCETNNLLIFTRQNYKIISDYDDLMCENGSKFTDIENLCQRDGSFIMALGVTLTILGILGLLVGLTVALYYINKQTILIWLYAHNCCMWWISEEELDKNKIFDAFVSYSHKDIALITKHIIPELEHGTPQYRLCLHERDWLVGEFITDSVYRTVEQSRRTIVILSPNFLESVWGKMEFQIAHTNSLIERRIRVILIIYGDIGDVDKLDPEFRSYIKTNTYLKWGDPWFWEKLRYALPHTENGELPTSQIEESSV